jgi:low affinity Fe/Cu permease
MDKGKASLFTCFFVTSSQLVGKPLTFLLATLTSVVWGVTGSIFHYRDTWQLVITPEPRLLLF